MKAIQKEKKAKTTGLSLKRHFSSGKKSVFDQFTYEFRKSIIRNPAGDTVFQMENVEVPASWSQVATDILAQKYFRRTGIQKEGDYRGETSVRQVVHRLANCWTEWGKKYGYFESKEDAEVFYDEIAFMLLAQMAAPNSPQWFNTGLHLSYGINGNGQGHYYIDPDSEELKVASSAYERPQTHACFILSVEDDLVNEGGIMDLLTKEARIFKYGSGAGTNYSKIRGIHEKLSGGGYSSGLMSFLKVADKAAGAIKSGGTTRRAAKMVAIDLEHPEIQDLINWKLDEEKKVAALAAAGYSTDYEGEAYQTVSGQNINMSVRIPDAFFNLFDKNEDWNLLARTDGSVTDKVPAKVLWEQLCAAAWKCGDPGVQFDSTVNDWHTCPEGGPIRASNPCSEFMFLDNTGCNLASINLKKFWNKENKCFEVEKFEHACRLWAIVLEITTLMAQYPTREIATLSYEYRPIGLGFANLGGMLMAAGIPYNSDKGRAVAAGISSIMTGSAYKASAEMAEFLGAFKRFPENRQHMLRVIKNHRAAAYDLPEDYQGLNIKPAGLNKKYCPDTLLKAARKIWDEVIEAGERNGFRNAQATAIAPTGTIGLLMDCDTTGIEPDFALVKFKKLSGGGYFKIINNAVPEALKLLGYNEASIHRIVKYTIGHGTIKNAPHINSETLKRKGFSIEDISAIEKQAVSAFHISNLFTLWNLSEESRKVLAIPEKIMSDPQFNLLSWLAFSESEIEEANEYVCGNLTIEGAPELKKEHYPVFDCANRCGSKGKRYLQPSAHIGMMAAVQPFISGAISKTINFPNEATVEEIGESFRECWSSGLKACTIYRDGSKLSQPLSSSSSKKEESEENPDNLEDKLIDNLTPDMVLEAAQKILHASPDTEFKRQLSRVIEKKRLPDKRIGFTQKARIGGHPVYIRTGQYDDGTLGEIFIDMYKEGASFRSLLNCFAVAVSVGLQYGVPVEEFVEKFTFTRFEPSGPVEGHPNIKSCTSLPDFIFRMLAWEYLQREDLVHIKPEKLNSNKEKLTIPSQKAPSTLHQLKEYAEDATNYEQEQLSSLMGDAPPCNMCGHITIRSGTCYRCLNCGNSLGCS